MTEKRHQPIDFTNIRDLLSVIFKRKYTILAVFVVVFGTVALYAFLAPGSTRRRAFFSTSREESS